MADTTGSWITEVNGTDSGMAEVDSNLELAGTDWIAVNLTILEMTGADLTGSGKSVAHLSISGKAEVDSTGSEKNWN